MLERRTYPTIQVITCPTVLQSTQRLQRCSSPPACVWVCCSPCSLCLPESPAEGALRDQKHKVKTPSQTHSSEEEDETDCSLLSDSDRKPMYCWEEVAYTTEAAEQLERIERRELVIQEIWMNAYLNGTAI